MHPITSAFSLAAGELGFSFEPSFSVVFGDGVSVNTLGLVHQFGSEKGTLLFPREAEPTAVTLERLAGLGYYYSVLFPSYECYDRDLFTATLDDWHWFGLGGAPPEWYTGKQWA